MHVAEIAGRDTLKLAVQFLTSSIIVIKDVNVKEFLRGLDGISYLVGASQH
jgi:hypothetical protein